MKVQVPRHLGLKSARRTNLGTWDCAFGFADKLTKHLELDSEALSVLEFCFVPRSAEEIAAKFSLPLPDVESAIGDLKRAGVLGDCFEVPLQLQRYDRHILFYDQNGLGGIKAQEQISNAKVCLIGMGGIGNWVALNLIGAGLKEIRFVDFDTVELTNLTRQILFDETSLGKPKVAEAARVLTPKNSQTKVVAIDAKADGIERIGSWIAGCDFVVLSADRPADIHVWVDAACVRHGIPYLNIGYRDGSGIVGPLTVPGKTSCYQCFKGTPTTQHGGTATPEDLVEKWDGRYQASSFGPLNALVSTIGTLEVLKMLCAEDKVISLDTELAIDPLTMEIVKTAYHRDPACWQCSRVESVAR